jgi:hypothetical protein
VSFVVGVHFFALGALFRARFFHVLGGILTACGVIGPVLVFADAPQASIDTISGVIPGVVLLAFGWWERLHIEQSLRRRDSWHRMSRENQS